VISTPRLNTLRRECETLREAVELLKYILHINLMSKALSIEYLLKILRKRVADNKDNLTETCANSIIYRVVDDSLTIRAYAIHLLERAVA
jgi:hypothetical protein